MNLLQSDCCIKDVILEVVRLKKHDLCAAKKQHNMKKEYLSAPLPFVGQKRMFASEYKKILEEITGATVFVDLFGGSGLLSHITKRQKPEATVIYNDFDGYQYRLAHIGQTNQILAELRELTKDVPRHKILLGSVKRRVLSLLEQKESENVFVDYITLSSSLLFSMKYKLSLEDIGKESMYNNIRKTDYDCAGYLDGLEITCCDYRELFEKYKDRHDVVFLVDPPYLNTETGTYNMSWKLPDYLDVLKVLCGQRYVYFTSNKSGIIELCNWLGNNKDIGNPFKQAHRKEFNARMNHNSQYTDIMLFNAI